MKIDWFEIFSALLVVSALFLWGYFIVRAELNTVRAEAVQVGAQK